MAYSPLDEGRLLRQPGARAGRGTASAFRPREVALAWLLRDPNVAVIPKAARIEHVRANRRALDLALDGAGARGARPRIPAAAAQNGARHDLKSARDDSVSLRDSGA